MYKEVRMSRPKKSSSTPAAKSALERFKYELADELGLYKGKRTHPRSSAKDNPSIGDYLVDQMIKTQQDKMS